MKNYYFALLVIFSTFVQNGKCQVESITEVTVLNITPKQIYDFMFSLTQEKYLKWHPEHREFRIVALTPEIVGSIFYFNDDINGSTVENSWKVISLETNKKIVMKASQYGVSLIIEIILKEVGSNTQVTHYLKIGKGMTNWIVKLFFTEKMIKDLHKHVEEEYKNLEWLLQ